MKTIDALLQQHLTEPLTSLATCWHVTLLSGGELGFTDHDRDIRSIDITGYVGTDITFTASTGYDATDVASNGNLDVDNLDIQGLLLSDSINEDDLRRGIWDGASIRIFQVNWQDLSMGLMWMRVGKLGKVTQGRNQWKAELLGLMYAYQTSIIQITQAGCRATFGDQRCGINASLTTLFGVIDSYDIQAMALVISDRLEADDYWAFGKVTFTSGENLNYVAEIRRYTVGQATLQTDPPFTVTPGDSYAITRGCGKSWDTWCRDVYDNLLNFRGEPHLMGNDILIQIGRRRT